MSDLLERIADTGDHPLGGSFCPGRHRAPWTAARARADAMAGLRQTFAPAPRGRHRSAVVRLLTLGELLAADHLVEVLDVEGRAIHLEQPATDVAGLVDVATPAGVWPA